MKDYTGSVVFLASKGLNERRATAHIYDSSKVVQKRNENGVVVNGLAHFYRCTETGETRQYGFERVTYLQVAKENDDAASN